MENDGFKFDLETQRFLVSRWNTDLGREVRDNVLSGLKNSVEVRAILDPYVLEHEMNIEPYGYPIYPSDAMTAEAFWVLTSDDLRGIAFYNEDISNSPSFEKKSLSYAGFYNCNLSGSNLESTDLSFARLEKCDLTNTVFAGGGGFSTRMIDCTAAGACFWQTGWRGCDFSGTDFSRAYFEDALIEGAKVDYRTRLDPDPFPNWKTRTMPPREIPDYLLSVRLAYERAELWSQMDTVFFSEKRAQRRHLLWPALLERPSFDAARAWLLSLLSAALSGYSTSPLRVLLWGLMLIGVFAATYAMSGMPVPSVVSGGEWLDALYLSLTTFSTLGFGDVTYPNARPWMRILTTVEAVLGAIWISLFVVVLARKAFR